MMKRVANLLVIFYALFFIACNQSDLSNGEIDKLSQIGADITISQDVKDKNKNYINLNLFDNDGNTIANKTIKIRVNGIAMELNQRQELYYNVTSKYIAENIPIKNFYNFDIVLSDGKTYSLAHIKAIAPVKGTIDCPEKGDFSKDFVVKWSDLNELDELLISKSVLLKSSTPTEQKIEYEPDFTKKISSSGNYTIPKSSFSNSKSTISTLELTFNTTKFGVVDPQLNKKSKIKITTSINKRIFF